MRWGKYYANSFKCTEFSFGQKSGSYLCKMKVILCCVGKTDIGYVADALQIFEKRLKHYIPFEIIVVPERKEWKKMDSATRKKAEGDALLEVLGKSDKVYLLDEGGKEQGSERFASLIQKEMSSGLKRLVFVIGGAFGFSEAIYGNFPARLALSKMTFSHQMIRMIFAEQLYRAMTILKNEPYHNT